MPSYNLLNEPWLPVRWRGEAPPSEVGLRVALLKAHEIEELTTDNPLETLALNRLLAAMAAAIFPELAEESDWYELWQQGHFDAEQCENYWTQFEGHFDLLSPTLPFFGHPNPEAREVSPLSRLLHASASGNNAVLFSHELDCVPKSLSLPEVARAMVCTQAAALGGGVAQPFNLSHGPLVGGAFFWLRGKVDHKPSLFEALLLNLAPMAEVWGNTPDDDLPCWEAKQPPLACKRDVGGIRDLFTFQSRRLQLVPDAHGRITGVRYNQGSKIDKQLFRDPHLAYRAGKEGVFPLRFNTARALWQDSAVFMMTLTKKGEGGHAPRTFEWLSSFRATLGLDREAAFSADVFGMVNDQAKVEFWRHERVTLYPDILNDADRWHALNELITEAHWHDKRLRDATRAFATRSRLKKPWGASLNDGERNEVDAFAQALDTGSRYWPALGQAFPSFLRQMATVPVGDLGEVGKKWQDVARKTARDALSSVLDRYPLSHSSWQAITEAETVLQTGKLPSKSIKSPSA